MSARTRTDPDVPSATAGPGRPGDGTRRARPGHARGDAHRRPAGGVAAAQPGRDAAPRRPRDHPGREPGQLPAGDRFRRGPLPGALPVPRHGRLQDAGRPGLRTGPRRRGVRGIRGVQGVLRGERRPHRARPGPRRLPRHLLPGAPSPQVPLAGPGLGPRAVQPRPPHPGRRRRRPPARRRAAAARGPPLRRPRRRALRRGRRAALLRPPRGGDGAGRALPGDRGARVPAPGRAVREPARLAGADPLGLPGRLLPGRGAAARAALGHRPCRAHGVSGGRGHGRVPGDRRRRDAGAPGSAVGRHGRHEAVPDGRPGPPPLRRGDRRPLRAAVGAGVRRDLRGDRHDAVGLAAVPGDGAGGRAGRRGARAVQRLRGRYLAGRAGVLLRQPAPAAPRPRAAQRRGGGRRAAAAGVVRLPLLPAERGAVDRTATGPRGRRGRRRGDDRALRRGHGAYGRARRDDPDRLPVGRPGDGGDRRHG
jgi:hypothetical protein